MRWVGGFVVGACLCATASAEPPFLEIVKAKYHAGTCQTCHVTPPVRNVFGQAVESAMQKAGVQKVTTEILAALERLDTDRDGVSNGDELRAGTSPGDPKNKIANGNLSADNSLLPKHAFHPLVVHFPIALFLFGVFLDVVGSRRQDPALRRFAIWNLGFGAIASVGAVVTGVTSFFLRQFPFQGVPLFHMLLGIIACSAMCTAALLKRRNPEVSGAYWLVVAVATTCIVVGGHLGMTLVYG